MTAPLRVFLGYDHRQPVAAHVALHSLMTRASRPVAITPLILPQLAPFARRGLTDFTFSRFLVPWLSDQSGYAVFMDSDVLVLGDIYDLLDALVAAQSDFTVAVRAHLPKHLHFERTAVMVFNCARCTKLTPEYINSASTGELYGLAWAGENVLGFGSSWHHLAGYDEAPSVTPQLIHYTQGIPLHVDTIMSPYAREWQIEREDVNHTVPWLELMGNSVHATDHEGRRVPKLAVKPLVERVVEAQAAK